MASRSSRKIDLVVEATDRASGKLGKIAGATHKAAAAASSYQNVLYGTTKATAILNKEQQGYVLTADRMRGSTTGLRHALGQLRNTLLLIVFATGGLVSIIKKSITASNEAENALLGLSSVAKNTGQAIQLTEDSALQLSRSGLLSIKESSEGLRNLLAAGFGLREARDLMDALTESAAFNRQGTLALGQAVVGATQGIKNGNSIMVDNAGITKNLSVLYREYAAAVGKTAGVLTEVEKRQAIYAGVLREAAAFSGDAIKVTQTLNGQLARLRVEVFETSVAIGNSLKPATTDIIGSFSKVAVSVREWIKSNQDFIQHDLVGTVRTTIRAVVELISAISGVISPLMKLAPFAIKTFLAFTALKQVIGIFNRIKEAISAVRLALIAYETAARGRAFLEDQIVAAAKLQASMGAGGLQGAMTRLALASNTTDAALLKQIITTRNLSTAQVVAALNTTRFAMAQTGLGYAVQANISLMARFGIAMKALFTGPSAWAILGAVALAGLVYAIERWITSSSRAKEASDKLIDSQLEFAAAQKTSQIRILESAVEIDRLSSRAMKLQTQLKDTSSSAFKHEQQTKELRQTYQQLNETLEPIRTEFDDTKVSLENLTVVQRRAVDVVDAYNKSLVQTLIHENFLKQTRAEASIESNKLLKTIQLLTHRSSLARAPKEIAEIFRIVAKQGTDLSETTEEGQKNLILFADAAKKRAMELSSLALVNPALREQARLFAELSAKAEEFAGPIRALMALRGEVEGLTNPLIKNNKVISEAVERYKELARTGRGEQIELIYGFTSPGSDEPLSSPEKFIGKLEDVGKKIVELAGKAELLSQSLSIKINVLDFEKLLEELDKGFDEASKKGSMQKLVEQFARPGSLVAVRAQMDAFKTSERSQLELFKENEMAMTEVARRLGIEREQLRGELEAFWAEARFKSQLENMKTQYDRLMDLQRGRTKVLLDAQQELELAGLEKKNQQVFNDTVGFENRLAAKQLELRRKNIKDLAEVTSQLDPRVSASTSRSERMQGAFNAAGVAGELNAGRQGRVGAAASAHVLAWREAIGTEKALLDESTAAHLQKNQTIIADLEASIGAQAQLMEDRAKLVELILERELLKEESTVLSSLKIRQNALSRFAAIAGARAMLEKVPFDRVTEKAWATAKAEIAAAAFATQKTLQMRLDTEFKTEQIMKTEHDLRVQYAEKQLELETMTSTKLLDIRLGLQNASRGFAEEFERSFEHSSTVIFDRLLGNTEGTVLRIKDIQKDMTDFQAKLIEIQIRDKQKAFKHDITAQRLAAAVAISAAAATTAAVLRGLATVATEKAAHYAAEAFGNLSNPATAGLAPGNLLASAKFAALAGTISGTAAAISNAGRRKIDSFSERADELQVEGGLGTTTTGTGGRKFGGTIEAKQLSITIAPSITIEAAGDVFLSDGSVEELESNVGKMSVRAIQNALDTNEIDLSKAVGMAS